MEILRREECRVDARAGCLPLPPFFFGGDWGVDFAACAQFFARFEKLFLRKAFVWHAPAAL